jgi:hypothetical protein
VDDQERLKTLLGLLLFMLMASGAMVVVFYLWIDQLHSALLSARRTADTCREQATAEWRRGVAARLEAEELKKQLDQERKAPVKEERMLKHFSLCDLDGSDHWVATVVFPPEASDKDFDELVGLFKEAQKEGRKLVVMKQSEPPPCDRDTTNHVYANGVARDHYSDGSWRAIVPLLRTHDPKQFEEVVRQFKELKPGEVLVPAPSEPAPPKRPRYRINVTAQMRRDAKTRDIALAAKACEDAGLPVPREAAEHLAKLNMTAQQAICASHIDAPVTELWYPPGSGRDRFLIHLGKAVELGAEFLVLSFQEVPGARGGAVMSGTIASGGVGSGRIASGPASPAKEVP